MAQLPPLPQIAGDFDIMLDVYTHESARPPTADSAPEYGDVARLEVLGRKAAEMAVTYQLFCQGTNANRARDLTSAEDIPVRVFPLRLQPLLDILLATVRRGSALYQDFKLDGVI